MRPRARLLLLLVLSAAFLPSCASTPEQVLARHAKRGDEYMRQEKYNEAVIEYKNAVKAVPADGTVRWKLAQAALGAKDLRTAYQELQRVAELEPGNMEALLRLGELHLLAGKTAEAGRIADNLVKAGPQDPKGYLLKSGVQLQEGRIDEAIAQLGEAVRLDPKAARPMLTLGNVFLLKRDLKAAREWFDRALAAEPNLPEVHVTRGNYFFATGERDEGDKEYRTAIAIGNDKESLRIALAEHYLYQGRSDDAARELEAVIRELKSQKARKVLAELRIGTGNIAGARAIVDAILKEDEKDVEGKYLKGRIALAEKRLDDARTLFEEVISQDAGMVRARLYNGMTAILQGHVEEGKKEVQEAVRLDPGSVQARLVLGDIYLKSGAPAAAEKEAVEVLRRNPANVLAAAMYADSFLFRKDWKKAEQVYMSMIRQMERDPVGYYKMGISRKLQGKPAEAASYFSQAVARNPKDLTSLNEYVFALAASKQDGKAAKIVDDYLAKNPNEPLLWEMAGRYHAAQRRPDRAEAAFLKAVALAPDFVRPYYELGILYVSQRKLPEAEARLRKVVEKSDKDAGAHALLGVVLDSQGRVEDANRQYRRALELQPRATLAANNLAANLCDHGGNLDEALKFAQIAREAAPEDPTVADTLGWIYFRKGLLDTAGPLIEEASKKLGTNAVVRYHHGMALAKRGRKKEAAAELSAALALDGRFPGADEARTMLKTLK